MSNSEKKNGLSAKSKIITVALTGNPNCGKTTIFNNLTGARQHVGNYGGVTVETKEGIVNYDSHTIRVVDLPGTYSLTPYSIEEAVVREFILREKPDVVVNIIDGSNLERNLYLPAQLVELGSAMVLVVNMADEMDKQGISVNKELLGDNLGGPVVLTVGTRNKGTKELLKRIAEVATGKWNSIQARQIRYCDEIERELEKIAELIVGHIDAKLVELHRLQEPHDFEKEKNTETWPRWIALKLLENDREVLEILDDQAIRQEVLDRVEHSRSRLTSIFGDDPEMMIAEQRYGYIHGIYRAAVRRTVESRINISDKIDNVLTNRLLGLPIFAALMYLTFWFVFTVGAHPMGWIESGIGLLSERIEILWPVGNAVFMRSLVLDGIIAGVGGVVVFLPNIMLLFLALALLEDTGYMARAAFIMDRLMKWVGLHGKSFIPMITGFGCSVPGIMGTRILDNRRDRLTTILVLPLMSCGARLPIYMLIIPAFFPIEKASMVMFSIYIIGIVLAVICAKLLRSIVFTGASSPFVMELPPYRIPTLRAILLHMWQRSWLYLRKAGTIILAFSILMWALATFPRLTNEKRDEIKSSIVAARPEYSGLELSENELAYLELTEEEIAMARLSYSVTGRIGHFIEPALKPLGFDWRIGTALIGSFPAKELFVSQLGIVYSLGEVEAEESFEEINQDIDSGSVNSSDELDELDADKEASTANILRVRLAENYSPLVGFCIMLFCLISVPCMATVAVTKREVSWGWALAQVVGLTVLAYVVTFLVYQIGRLLL